MSLPQHVAIIMDGNGRWAKQRHLPRMAGHKAGVETVRRIVEFCVEHKIGALTLFAFGKDNWRRPTKEVNFLMKLFFVSLEGEAKKLHKENIQVRIRGDRSELSVKLQKQIAKVEALTANNTGLKLTIATNYSGQWDIHQAVSQLTQAVEEGTLSAKTITPELFAEHLTLADLPDPDLFIRTSGETRISNFMLWQLAYTELYFTEVLWPDFNAEELKKAIHYFENRERRFGYTSEQIAKQKEVMAH